MAPAYKIEERKPSFLQEKILENKNGLFSRKIYIAAGSTFKHFNAILVI